MSIVLALSDPASGRVVALCVTTFESERASVRIGGAKPGGEAWEWIWFDARHGTREEIEGFVAAARRSGLRFERRAVELPVVGGETLVPGDLPNPFFAPSGEGG